MTATMTWWWWRGIGGGGLCRGMKKEGNSSLRWQQSPETAKFLLQQNVVRVQVRLWHAHKGSMWTDGNIYTGGKRSEKHTHTVTLTLRTWYLKERKNYTLLQTRKKHDCFCCWSQSFCSSFCSFFLSFRFILSFCLFFFCILVAVTVTVAVIHCRCLFSSFLTLTFLHRSNGDDDRTATATKRTFHGETNRLPLVKCWCWWCFPFVECHQPLSSLFLPSVLQCLELLLLLLSSR